jgi:hypothetical protein
MLSTAYKILSNILLSRLSLHIDKIIGDHQCWVRHKRSTTDQIFAFVKHCRRNENTMRVYQLLRDFIKSHDSVGKEVLYNILIEFGLFMKLVRLINLFKLNVE